MTARNVYVPVRYRILGLLFLLSFVNYLLRHSMSVALPSIREEFSFTTAELGWILGSFNIAYALAQVPAGVFGDVFGPRRALGVAAVTWGLLTAVTGFLPELLAASAGGVLVSFIVIRFLLGIANAPIFPVAAGAIARWFPAGSWGFPNAALSSGLTLGQAAVGPVASMLILQFGWRESFYVLAPVGLLAGAWWWWYGRDEPREHRAVSAAEVQFIEAGRVPSGSSPRDGWAAVLRNRDVLLLAASYFCMNYVFFIFTNWLFTYLVEERGFGLLESGFISVLPFVVGALFAALGGAACDRLCERLGPRWGCRLPGLVGLVMVAWLLLAGAGAPSPVTAVVLLSLCFGFTQFTEGAYWQATTYAAGPLHAATASGALNMGGNLAGFLAPVVGLVVDGLGWWPALATGSVFALLGAALWLFVGAQPGTGVRT